MSKGTTQKTTENSTTTNQSPQYVQDAAKWLVNAGTNMTDPFLQVPNQLVAGFTPDQLAGMDLGRQIAQNTVSGPKWQQNVFGALGGGNTYSPFEAATIDMGRVGDVTQQLLNPYMQNVVDTTMRRMGQDRDATAAQIGARAAAASPFGGSGEAIQRAQLDRSHGDNVSSTLAGLLSQGFNQAQQSALGIAQTEAANRQSADATNAAGLASGGESEKNRYLNAIQLGSSLEDADINRQLMGLQTLLSGGQMQQDQFQAGLDAPWKALAIQQGITPQDQSGTSTTNGTKSTTSSGGGSLISGLAGLLSLPMGGGMSIGGSIAGKLFGR